MYADDVKIFLSFNNINEKVLIQNDINYLTSWCSTNLMELNVKKCKYMCVTDHFQPMDFIQRMVLFLK